MPADMAAAHAANDKNPRAPLDPAASKHPRKYSAAEKGKGKAQEPSGPGPSKAVLEKGETSGTAKDKPLPGDELKPWEMSPTQEPDVYPHFGSQGARPQGPSDLQGSGYTYVPGSKPTDAPDSSGQQAPAGARPPSKPMEQGGPVPHSGSENGKGSMGLGKKLAIGALAFVGLDFLLRSSADVTTTVEIT